MKSSDSGLTDDVIAALADRQLIKVWSVIVTIFGDLAQNQDDEISGLTLSAITERIGIRPEAMRVAIHRLRKDNWIESRKSGRVSNYRLSPFGRSESMAVSPRIYGQTKAEQAIADGQWYLTILPPGSTYKPASSDQFEIRQGVMLGHEPPDNAPSDVLTVCFEKLDAPQWVRDALLPEMQIAAYENFHKDLIHIQESLNRSPELSALDVLVVRVLIVHTWRRLLLRHPESVDAFFPEGWAGSECRSRVAAILHELPRPNLAAIAIQ